jgi:uncharacterized protein (DUF885 family)
MLLTRVEEFLHDAEEHAALIFDLCPKAPVIVKREPSSIGQSAAADYTSPAKDGSRHGVFGLPMSCSNSGLQVVQACL